MEKRLIFLSIFLLIISICLQIVKAFPKEDYELSYEYINVKDIAQVVNSEKESSPSKNLTNAIINVLGIETYHHSSSEENPWQAVEFVKTSYSKKEKPPEVVENPWHFPTEMGNISQKPNYYHAAFDITSPRGSAEVIYPVANGVVSGIYRDSAGALIVTVLHNINGEKFTSQYVHLSRYADNLYVGKNVTINDALGWMGTTGQSTGVHLHLAVVDCALFDGNDPKCPDLNRFFSYSKGKVASGYWGLGSYFNLPQTWNSRE